MSDRRYVVKRGVVPPGSWIHRIQVQDDRVFSLRPGVKSHPDTKETPLGPACSLVREGGLSPVSLRVGPTRSQGPP